LSNDELLLDYGFIVKDNPFDCVKLRWDLKLIELAREIGGLTAAPMGEAASGATAKNSDTVAKLAPWQTVALERIGLIGDDANVELVVLGVGQVMDKKALAGLRVLYSKSEAEASRAADAPFGEIDADVVSKDTEIKALRTCMSLSALALGNFSTTLEKDEELLEAASTPQMRLAIAFRMEKKKVLVKSMARMNESIVRLQGAA
jgi:histone-lysine N-methyltransferase SETD3